MREALSDLISAHGAVRAELLQLQAQLGVTGPLPSAQTSAVTEFVPTAMAASGACLVNAQALTRRCFQEIEGAGNGKRRECGVCGCCRPLPTCKCERWLTGS